MDRIRRGLDRILHPNEEEEDEVAHGRQRNRRERVETREIHESDVSTPDSDATANEEAILLPPPASDAAPATPTPVIPPTRQSRPSALDAVEQTRREADLAAQIENNPAIREAIERMIQEAPNTPASEQELENMARILYPYFPKGITEDQVREIVKNVIAQQPGVDYDRIQTMISNAVANKVSDDDVKSIVNNATEDLRKSIEARPVTVVTPVNPTPDLRTSANQAIQSIRTRIPAPRRRTTPVTSRNSDVQVDVRNGRPLWLSLLAGLLILIVAFGAVAYFGPGIARGLRNTAHELMVVADNNPNPTQAPAPAATAQPQAQTHLGVYNGHSALLDQNGNFVGYIMPDGSVVQTLPNTDTNGGNSNGSNNDSQAGIDAHNARLVALDPSFRSGGWTGWMKAAGFTWDAVRDARQPEEETIEVDGVPNGYVSGLQIVATNVAVNYPNAVTTDTASRITRTSSTFDVLANSNTGSRLYTNVIANGPVTIYADVRNWGQFVQRFGVDGKTAHTEGSGATNGVNTNSGSDPNVACLTKADLKKLGSVIQWLKRSDGSVGGAQLRLNQDITAVDGSNLQRNGQQNLASAKKGQVVSYWLNDSCDVNGGASASTFRTSLGA